MVICHYLKGLRTNDQGQILTFCFEIANGIAPEYDLLVVAVDNGYTIIVLPPCFACDYIAGDEFDFDHLFVFNKVLNNPNAGQVGVKVSHN